MQAMLVREPQLLFCYFHTSQLCLRRVVGVSGTARVVRGASAAIYAPVMVSAVRVRTVLGVAAVVCVRVPVVPVRLSLTSPEK